MCVCLYMPLPLLAPLLLRVCADPNSHAMDCPRLRKPCLPEGRGAAVLLREWNHIVWDKLAYGPPLPDNSKQLIHVGFFDTRPSPSLWEMGKAAALFNSSGVVVHALLAVKPVAADVPSGIRVTMMKLTKRLACIYDNFAHNSHGPGPAYLIKTLLPWILPPEVPRIILLDTDTVVLRPIIKLWSVFESFGDRAVIGIAREQSNLYENMVGRNGGVQLMNLVAARASATYVRYLDRIAAGRTGYYVGYLGDQTLFVDIVSPDLEAICAAKGVECETPAPTPCRDLPADQREACAQSEIAQFGVCKTISCTALAIAAGLFNGSYPIFLKRPAVLAARVPPLFFQSAKSSCCCLLGACLVLLRLARSGEPFLFTWWAVASAAAWIPAGLCTIAAVPRLGVGPVMLTSAGTGTLASFLAGSIALGERLKVHTLDGGGTFLLAPAYLAGVLLGMAGVLLGMAGLIFAPRLSLQRARQHPSAPLVLAEEEGEADSEALHSPRRADAEGLPVAPRRRAKTAAATTRIAPSLAGSLLGAPLPPFDRVGYALAAAAGVFASVQYVMVLRAAVLPGLGAGLCWTAGNLLSTLAVELGGNAVTASNLVTSGAWSLLFYREFSGRAAAVWAAAAAFTMAMVVLLGFEKVKE
ncbi:hypothetical protein EMIHUDRAFT_111342 [Emiliania huxleyi CCMP1516]|uniref:Uncharacterized protein n=2 Tax=Emiliania huxleyi TaxID=2903 RepID=A0A0D3KED0_EMIH1|nr:hypothetical protein EMIHUDRAFT_111342 [Emiliania huxleyi CCMP1516]EOD34115.1 hypothetical protein EMIHUDRAFT_111342 [Emiliania huxleyi CCMP1516]|eukprot:XP_005786544.1 hypothetical protein EMIHUDRAFT_111342 [Emiliania huxleyi CCMP1516]